MINFAAMKTLLSFLGIVSLALGIAGIFLPLLPTTPFLLLSAWLFVRSSPRLYAWLTNHPRLGPYIRNFRENRAIPLRVKIVSVTMVWLTIGYCVVAVVDEWLWAQAAMVLLAAGITAHLLSYATLKEEQIKPQPAKARMVPFAGCAPLRSADIKSDSVSIPRSEIPISRRS